MLPAASGCRRESCTQTGLSQPALTLVMKEESVAVLAITISHPAAHYRFTVCHHSRRRSFEVQSDRLAAVVLRARGECFVSLCQR